MLTLLTAVSTLALSASPVFLDEQFELPPGFRIYKAAGPELTGGSYDIAMDADGRLLIGDGTQVRRLEDRDGDGLFDASEVIATGLGPRGPQGLLVWEDRLYAVGGDGVQLFTGYPGPLHHEGRIGARFGTGGDHDAHTVLRGHDGHAYFITGDGAGARERVHITEASSPALFERSCSVFRFSPDGKRWECVATGGRNAPNLGINYLGELFSLDSDMEWHVDLPWWRPVRLNHWTAGGDQGWQDVGAYPPYYLDCLSGIHDIGRGSPNWGVFYEHRQFPARYRDGYLVCDYLSKSATTGGYATSGRLFAFALERRGAGWSATSEVLARPRPNARDDRGQPIGFALVDIEVAPDGSLLLSDHQQGVWRLLFDPGKRAPADPAFALRPAWPVVEPARALDEALSLPQPASEWSRAREAALLGAVGERAAADLLAAALDRTAEVRRRLRAVRLLTPRAGAVPATAIETLAADPAWELRAQAAWLLGLRGETGPAAAIPRLLGDADPFVRRRALEALVRAPSVKLVPRIVDLLADPERLVRYVAMTALAHLPPADWLGAATARPSLQMRLRALVAADLRREPPAGPELRRIVAACIDAASPGDAREDRLDLLRVLGRFRQPLAADRAMAERIETFVGSAFPDADRDVRFEQARLLGEYRAHGAFGKLLTALESEADRVMQFHLAQALARIPGGWSPAEEERAVAWFLGTQHGWFAEPAGKGLEFPEFWTTVLAELAAHHGEALLRQLPQLDLGSPVGKVVIDLLGDRPDGAGALIGIYLQTSRDEVRRRVARALAARRERRVAIFLRDALAPARDRELRSALLMALAQQEPEAESDALLLEGLLHDDPGCVASILTSLATRRLELTERLAGILVSLCGRRQEPFRPAESLLARLSGTARPAADGGERQRERPTEAEVEAARSFWSAWFRERFKKELDPAAIAAIPERGDDQIRAFVLGEGSRGGDAAAGRRVYEAARCASCHGGLGTAADRIFGPDLTGVTRRLNREELADAIVAPSKTVPDRFKAVFIQTASGAALSGFVTDENAETVTLVDQERAHRLAPGDIVLRAPLETSLMPERLLNRLDDAAIRDLLAFLDELGNRAGDAVYEAEAIFPPEALHNHGSCIVECPGGDLLVCWYRGSGERKADDVAVLGARRRRGDPTWSPPFVLADSPGFPDTNPCMVVDSRGKLWLFWQVILANEWHTALTQYKVSSDYAGDGAPRWETEQPLLLRPGPEFGETLEAGIRELERDAPPELKALAGAWAIDVRRKAADKLSTRLGWMTRPHPVVLDGTRLLVPLYSDGFNVSLMAWTEDWGGTWSVSRPLVGGGNVQPSVVRRKDGTLRAYMRDNGPPPKRILISDSTDGGRTWSRVTDSDIPNPGSGLEAIALRDGRWALANNDTERGRDVLSVWLSADEGKTWPWRRRLEPRADFTGGRSASYPSIIESSDGMLHVTYSRSTTGQTIFHVRVSVGWIKQGDAGNEFGSQVEKKQ